MVGSTSYLLLILLIYSKYCMVLIFYVWYKMTRFSLFAKKIIDKDKINLYVKDKAYIIPWNESLKQTLSIQIQHLFIVRIVYFELSWERIAIRMKWEFGSRYATVGNPGMLREGRDGTRGEALMITWTEMIEKHEHTFRWKIFPCIPIRRSMKKARRTRGPAILLVKSKEMYAREKGPDVTHTLRARQAPGDCCSIGMNTLWNNKPNPTCPARGWLSTVQDHRQRCKYLLLIC